MSTQSPLKIIQPDSNSTEKAVIQTTDFNVWIKDQHILNDISIRIPKNQITCIIGPSGSGKSTLIRSLNRINDEVTGFSAKGTAALNDKNIYDPSVDTAKLRGEVGMVFQKPCVFPKSIKENVLFGIQHQKKLSKHEKLEIVEKNLKAASLWKEVSHRLNDKASSLSIGQQQRLSIARTLAVEPQVILLDEPTSSLDPVSTRAIEEMMVNLKNHYTIVFVTHNIRQAKRIADHLIFICEGTLIEQNEASTMFNNPKHDQTQAYLNDEYCDC